MVSVLLMVDGMPEVSRAMTVRSQRLLESQSLVVAFTLSFGFGAVVTDRLGFVTFDASLSTSCSMSAIISSIDWGCVSQFRDVAYSDSQSLFSS